ncbi:hypothetical protein HOY34_20500 [Xinfangfangia sp. D13-10-4-6]|uniref:hypothetical protein n=1 Tax=Pseudogemmobacter hezensis TaxID=2737662 RepID=UPI001551ACB5|nr:hypothetical protein [Pseudogemmobacter hezensis]NPD17569.1 hypothetical protein [Pseudogemmobacter hezensis]
MRDHVDLPQGDDEPGGIHHDMEGELGDLDLETLSGDIRDEMLSRMKHLKATWGLLSQAEQAEVGNGLELFSKSLIRKVIGKLAKHEFPHVVVSLAEFKVKGGKDIEAKITCPNIAVNRDPLGDRVGDMCMLVMADAETFFGERAPVKTDPDQPGLDLDGDGGSDPAEADQRLALPKPTADLQSPDDETDNRPAEGDLE